MTDVNIKVVVLFPYQFEKYLQISRLTVDKPEIIMYNILTTKQRG